MDGLHTHVADPLLNAITSSLVIRTITIQIIVDLLIREGSEANLRDHRKGDLPLFGGYDHTRYDLVHMVRKCPQHGKGRLPILWFSQHAIKGPNNRVRRDQQLIRCHRSAISLSLRFRDMQRDLCRAQGCRIGLVDTTDRTHLKRHIQSRQQLLSSWRVAGENNLVFV